MPNPGGHPETLVPATPGNTRALRHGVYSKNGRALEPRAREIAETILSAPHTHELDEIGAVEIGRLEALIEALDEEIAKRGIVNGRGQVRTLVDLRLRASKRLADWLARFGMDPESRSTWAARMAQPSFAETVERIRREREESNGRE